MVSVRPLLNSLVLSAEEIRAHTDWDDAMIEDYLTIIDNITLIAQALDENAADLEQQINIIGG